MPGSLEDERFRKLLLSLPGDAIGILYKSYYLRLIRVSMRYTRDHDAAVDIVQDTMVQVWEKFRDLGQKHERSIEYYLVKVVKNRSILYLKKRIQFDDVLVRFHAQTDVQEVSTEAGIIERESIQELRALISAFPKRERECLLMSVDDGMTTLQISLKLNIEHKAAQRGLTAAKKRLRRLWEQKNS